MKLYDLEKDQLSKNSAICVKLIALYFIKNKIMIPQIFTENEIRKIKLCPNPQCNSDNIIKHSYEEGTEVRVRCGNNHLHSLHVYDFGKLGRGIYFDIINE